VLKCLIEARRNAQGPGPCGILEHPVLWVQHDIGVDERGPAEATADDGTQIVVEAKVEESSVRAEVSEREVELSLRHRLAQGVREVPRPELTTTFEQTHAESCA